MARSEPDTELAYLLKRAEESNREKERRFLAAGSGEAGAEGHSRRVGIMGGTFDPIHYGHLMAANTAMFEYRMEFVIFVPSGRPPHKKERLISEAEHRYRMTLLAVESNPGFIVSRVEIDREGYSYAIDTVKHFAALLGPQVELYFITGADAVLEILTWKNVSQLIAYCSFLAVTRPGFDLNQLKFVAGIDHQLLAKIHLLEIPALAISSSEIRHRVKHQQPIRYLLPETVESYLQNHQLYKNCNPGKL